MPRTTKRFACFLSLTLLAACSSSSAGTSPPPNGNPDGGGTADSGTGTHSNGNGGTCCLNGSFYNCTSQDAFNKCAGFDIDACMKACSAGDAACQQSCFAKWTMATHDPSACMRDSSKDGTCTSTPPPNDGGTTGCKGSGTSPTGASCSIDSQCCSENCTGSTCQTNAIGAACSIDSQCNSSNCTGGQCQGNDPGSPCSIDSQCTSNNCTGGTCQP